MENCRSVGRWNRSGAETGARAVPLVAAIVVDPVVFAVVFAVVFVYRIRTDLVVIASFLAFTVLVAGAETLDARRSHDTDTADQDAPHDDAGHDMESSSS